MIYPYKSRLMKRSYHIFPEIVIYPRLPPHRTVDLSEESSWHLYKMNAPHIQRSRKSRYIPYYAASKGNEARVPIKSFFEQLGQDSVSPEVILILFAIGY